LQHLLPASPDAVLAELHTCGVVKETTLAPLQEARDMLLGLLFYLRLCAGEETDIARAPAGLTRILTQMGGCKSFEELEKKLVKTEKKVADMMKRVERL